MRESRRLAPRAVSRAFGASGKASPPTEPSWRMSLIVERVALISLR